jgi:hypothetical protein
LKSHFGCVALVALLQISGVGSFACLKRGVRIPGEPCGLGQQPEVWWKEWSLLVSRAKRIEGLVPCMPVVRGATLLNAILDELTHHAPVEP